MADDKANKAGGLLDQYNLLGAIIHAPWATRLDHKVARHVIDRYYPKHGNGRASLRYLERATGSSRSNITTSLRRLAYHGAIVMVRPGHGTRPSEFALNFDFSASVPVDVTSSGDFPSGTADVTSSGHADDTASNASVPVDVTKSYLPVPAYKAGVRIDRDDPRPPTAPPSGDGLAATPLGVSAVEEESERISADIKPTFEALWRGYGKERAGGKKEARAAWNALPPKTDLAAVIESAKAWREAWAKQNNPKAPRYTLVRWLADERFEQDVPGGFEPKEKASKAKPDKSIMLPMAIVDVKEEGSPFANWFVTIKLQDPSGEQIERQFHVLDNAKDDAKGPDADIYRELEKAAGAYGLLGAHVGVTEAKGKLKFHDIGMPSPKPLQRPEPEPWVGDVDRFAPFGTFPAKFLDSAVEQNEHGMFVTLVLEIIDNTGEMEITRQLDHTFAWKQHAATHSWRLFASVGISEIEDTNVLHGKVLTCTITDRGAIIYAALSNEMQQAA